MARDRRVNQVFNLLREQIEPGVMSDLEVLSSAVALVDRYPRPERARHLPSFGEDRSYLVEEQIATDVMLKRRGWRVFDDADAVVHGSFEADEDRFASAYHEFRRVSGW